MPIEQRHCIECGTALPRDSHPKKVLCSNRCTVARHRRIKKELNPVAPKQPKITVRSIKLELTNLLEEFKVELAKLKTSQGGEQC